MNQVLYVQVTNVKCNDIVDFRKWLAEVKHVDDTKCFESNQPLSRVLPLTVLLLVHKGNTLTASTSNTSTATTSGSRLNYPPQFIDNEKDLPTSEESWVPQVPQTICISQGCQQGAWLFLSNWDRISTCYCLDCCCCNACCLSLQGSRICPCQRQHV